MILRTLLKIKIYMELLPSVSFFVTSIVALWPFLVLNWKRSLRWRLLNILRFFGIALVLLRVILALDVLLFVEIVLLVMIVVISLNWRVIR